MATAQSAQSNRTLKDVPLLAVNAIPVFAGEEAKLPIFLRACNDFLITYYNHSVPEDPLNTQLVRLILTKLEGRALEVISIREDLKSWVAIKELLIREFSDNRSKANQEEQGDEAMEVDEAKEEEMDVQEEENHDLIPTVDDPIESKKCRYHIITVFNNPEVKIDKLPNNKVAKRTTFILTNPQQKTPLELLLGHTFSRDSFDIDYEKQWYENYTNKHLEKMKLLYSSVKERLHNRKIRRNEKINSKRKPPRKPTRAFIKTTKRVGKLKPQQEGPTEITEIDDRNIASTSSGKRVHLRQLRHPIFTGSQQQDATSSSAS
nr:unnamed protein product [Callosobruchus analis]